MSLKIGLSIWMFKPGTGGLQSHAEALSRHLRQAGHQTRLITRAYRKVPEFLDFLTYNEPPGLVEINGEPVVGLQIPCFSGLAAQMIRRTIHRPYLSWFGRALFTAKCSATAAPAFSGLDLIHHVGQSGSLIGFLAAEEARRQKIPFLVQPTCHPGQVGDSPLDRALYRRADLLLVHTQYEAAAMAKLVPRVPVRVVGNGIADRTDGNGERFLRSHKIQGPMILYVGRKEEDKGYHLTLQAFAKVKICVPNAVLVVMGPPGPPDVLVPPNGVLDLGYSNEEVKHDALAACTCLCVPSAGESFGLIFMEAGRYAKPVVARKLAVLEELLGNKGAALLLGKVDVFSSSVLLEPEELAQGLVALLEDATLREKLGVKAREVSANFTWPLISRNFEDAYYEVLR